jgi:hypothetical protein
MLASHAKILAPFLGILLTRCLLCYLTLYNAKRYRDMFCQPFSFGPFLCDYYLIALFYMLYVIFMLFEFIFEYGLLGRRLAF